MEPTTATAIRERHSTKRLEATMHRLLYGLKRYVRVYPVSADETLPDHEVVWETTIDGDPRRVILDAIKSDPMMWRDALPPDVVVVPRAMLAHTGLSADAIEVMAGYGSDMVDTKAAYFLHDLDFQNAEQST